MNILFYALSACRRLLAFGALAVFLAIILAGSASAGSVRICLRDILATPSDISCPVFESSSTGEIHWLPFASINKGEETCSYQFTTDRGEVIDNGAVPQTIRVSPGESIELVDWYTCSGGTGSRHSRVTVSAVNPHTGERLTAPVVSSVTPAGHEGNCSAATPCSTPVDQNITSITAAANAQGMVFIKWRRGADGERVIRKSPASTTLSGLKVAFYGNAIQASPCDRIVPQVGVPVHVVFPGCGNWPLTPRIVLENIINVRPLERICWLVSGGLNCPGCAAGYCPGYELGFTNVRGIDVYLFDRQSGKILAKGGRLGDNRKTLSFKPSYVDPKTGVMKPAYDLVYVPGALRKAKPGTIKALKRRIGVELKVRSR